MFTIILLIRNLLLHPSVPLASITNVNILNRLPHTREANSKKKIYIGEERAQNTHKKSTYAGL